MSAVIYSFIDCNKYCKMKQEAALMTGVVDESNVAQRPRMSQYPMVSVQEALEAVLKQAPPTRSTHTLKYQGLCIIVR